MRKALISAPPRWLLSKPILLADSPNPHPSIGISRTTSEVPSSAGAFASSPHEEDLLPRMKIGLGYFHGSVAIFL
jgi:hypothetical protein